MGVYDYKVEIVKLSDIDGGGFLATVPKLPGCMSDGETPEEALKNIEDAIRCWLDTAKELGRAIPEADEHKSEEDWYKFKDEAMERIAIEWYERNDINYER